MKQIIEKMYFIKILIAAMLLELFTCFGFMDKNEIKTLMDAERIIKKGQIEMAAPDLTEESPGVMTL